MNWNANRFVRPLAGLLLATAALPVHAQVAAPIAPASMPSFYATTKTEAILGGSSALAALLAQQSGTRVAAIAPAIAPLPFVRASFAVTPRPTFAAAAPGFVAASPDRPDVFNSVALAVGHTPLDGRWHNVAHSRVGGSAGSYAASLTDRGEGARLDAINTYVNHRVQFVDDIRQYGVADRWSPAAETLARGRGDCEDYAIAKMAMLRRAGFAERDLYLVILKDLVRRADHAVLVVRSEGHFRVLDNGTDRVLDSSDVHDYRPILTFNVAHTFTHGYRREVPVVAMAMAETAPAPLLAPLPAAPSYQTASAGSFSGVLPSMRIDAGER